MEIRSLAYRTDMYFPKYEGIVLDRGDYLVIRTPSNPHFFWGNYLLFSAPPVKGDLERWQALFNDEISSLQPADHMAFGWDSPQGEAGALEPFLAAGFELVEGVVLTTSQVRAPGKYNHDVVVRPLASDDDWAQALRNQMDCRPAIHAYEDYLPFKTAKMARYREMQRERLGAWFGAFLGEKLVADLGVYCSGGVGRFQSVETAPDYRRLGICGALVHQTAAYALAYMGAKTLVMVADEDYHAARIYESVGFQPAERQIGLQRWKPAG